MLNNYASWGLYNHFDANKLDEAVQMLTLMVVTHHGMPVIMNCLSLSKLQSWKKEDEIWIPALQYFRFRTLWMDLVTFQTLFSCNMKHVKFRKTSKIPHFVLLFLCPYHYYFHSFVPSSARGWNSLEELQACDGSLHLFKKTTKNPFNFIFPVLSLWIHTPLFHRLLCILW